MHPWLQAAIEWVMKILIGAFLLVVFVYLASVFRDVGNWVTGPNFEQRHANLIGPLGAAAVTAAVAFAALKFQTKTQSNAFKLEVYKLRLALAGKLCRKCHRLFGHLSGPVLVTAMDREAGMKWLANYHTESENLRLWFIEQSVYMPHQLFDPFQKFLDSAFSCAGMISTAQSKAVILAEVNRAGDALTRVVQEAQKSLNIFEVSSSTAAILSKHSQ